MSTTMIRTKALACSKLILENTRSASGVLSVRKQSSASESDVNIPMIRKMERICRNYIDQLENGGKHYNIQNFMMMYIFGSTTNTAYRTKLFDHWPTYLEDFNACKEIMGYRYPETLVEEFLTLGIDKQAKILDVACGPGNVAFILKDHAYTNIDGLDPSQGLLDAAMEKKLYNKTFCCYVSPDEKTPIADNAYDVLLCSAGMFPGSIVPQAFTELLRITKPGGIISWNIADGYEGFNDFFKTYDQIYKQLIAEKKWEEVRPVKKLDNMLFEDAGYTYVMRKL
eukprot:TRINITY_DN22996_c0_g1_i1.p1 TRINITY_DN22996_c0_g1~~TRINITY_DN22996_c0_g1_i1.p1  ORF type:complete len:293 (-),score=80.62 TRINITY_DN22996_c0_g1_i1:164-1012(-)